MKCKRKIEATQHPGDIVERGMVSALKKKKKTAATYLRSYLKYNTILIRK